MDRKHNERLTSYMVPVREISGVGPRIVILPRAIRTMFKHTTKSNTSESLLTLVALLVTTGLLVLSIVMLAFWRGHILTENDASVYDGRLL